MIERIHNAIGDFIVRHDRRPTCLYLGRSERRELRLHPEYIGADPTFEASTFQSLSQCLEVAGLKVYFVTVENHFNLV